MKNLGKMVNITGDCTTCPIACMRCQFEELYKVADDIISLSSDMFLKEVDDE